MSPRPRTVLFASVVLGVVAGLVAALLGVMRPAQERQEYASLPGACTTVSAATTAAARNVLAVLGGRPGFPASVVSGRYGAPGDTCQLIPLSVVARYLPGKVVRWNPDWSGTAPPPSTDTATCRWSQKPGIASVGVSLSLIPFAGGTTQDQEQFQTGVQTAAQPGIPGPGQQSVVEQVAPVAGVADQAAVVFRLDTADGVTTRVLDLIFWAGDAEVVLDLSYQGSAEPPAAVRLAHAVAMARSILGVLTRVKPWGPSMGIDI